MSLQALQEIPRERAEWILWLDMDLLIDKMDFVMPLDSYEGKDLIMHGQAEYILQGEARKGRRYFLYPLIAGVLCGVWAVLENAHRLLCMREAQ